MGRLRPRLHAVLFSLFGVSVDVILAAGAVGSLLIVGLTYVLARQVLPPSPAFVVAAIGLAYAVYGPHLMSYAAPYTFAATYGLCFGLLCMLATARALDSPRSRWDWVAGVAVGLAVMTKQDWAVITVTTVALGTALRLARHGSAALIALVRQVSAASLVVVPFLIWVLSAASFEEFRMSVYPTERMPAWEYWFELAKFGGVDRREAVMGSQVNFLASCGLIACLGALGGSLLEAWRDRHPRWKTIVLLAVLSAPFVYRHAFLDNFPLTLHAVALLSLWRWDQLPKRGLVGFLTVVAGVSLFRVYPNPDIGGFALSVFIPSLIITMYLLFYVTPILLGSFVSRASFQSALPPLMFGMLALYPLWRTTVPWAASTVALETPRGRVRVTRETHARIQAVEKHLQRFTEAGDPILLIPEGPMYAFLYERQWAGKNLNYLYGNLPDASFEEAEIEHLERREPKLIVLGDGPQSNYKPDPPARFGVTYNHKLASWIEENYEEVERMEFKDHSRRFLVPKSSLE